MKNQPDGQEGRTHFRKIKVLYLETYTHVSGGQRGLLDLVGALDRNLFDPVVVVQGSGDLKRGLEKSGVRCISRRMEPFRNRWLPYSWAIGVKPVLEVLKRES